MINDNNIIHILLVLIGENILLKILAILNENITFLVFLRDFFSYAQAEISYPHKVYISWLLFTSNHVEHRAFNGDKLKGKAYYNLKLKS